MLHSFYTNQQRAQLRSVATGTILVKLEALQQVLLKATAERSLKRDSDRVPPSPLEVQTVTPTGYRFPVNYEGLPNLSHVVVRAPGRMLVLSG